jgi:hypothetical protein
MKKTIIILFLIIVIFASIQFALFLDDISDMTSATTVENNELKYDLETNNNKIIEQNQTEEVFYDYL